MASCFIIFYVYLFILFYLFFLLLLFVFILFGLFTIWGQIFSLNGSPIFKSKGKLRPIVHGPPSTLPFGMPTKQSWPTICMAPQLPNNKPHVGASCRPIPPFARSQDHLHGALFTCLSPSFAPRPTTAAPYGSVISSSMPKEAYTTCLHASWLSSHARYSSNTSPRPAHEDVPSQLSVGSPCKYATLQLTSLIAEIAC